MQEHSISLYEGTEPYIFFSYSHRDQEAAERILSRLHADGYRVWYDEGIAAGAEWPEIIAKHLMDSACFFALISDAYIDSFNCKRELDYAVSKRKPILYARMGEVELPPGIELQLSSVQALIYREEKEESFYRRLVQSELLVPCRGMIPQGTGGSGTGSPSPETAAFAGYGTGSPAPEAAAFAGYGAGSPASEAAAFAGYGTGSPSPETAASGSTAGAAPASGMVYIDPYQPAPAAQGGLGQTLPEGAAPQRPPGGKQTATGRLAGNRKIVIAAVVVVLAAVAGLIGRRVYENNRTYGAPAPPESIAVPDSASDTTKAQADESASDAAEAQADENTSDASDATEANADANASDASADSTRIIVEKGENGGTIIRSVRAVADGFGTLVVGTRCAVRVNDGAGNAMQDITDLEATSSDSGVFSAEYEEGRGYFIRGNAPGTATLHMKSESKGLDVESVITVVPEQMAEGVTVHVEGVSGAGVELEPSGEWPLRLTMTAPEGTQAVLGVYSDLHIGFSGRINEELSQDEKTVMDVVIRDRGNQAAEGEVVFLIVDAADASRILGSFRQPLIVE